MNSGGVEAVVMNYYRAMDRSKVQFDFFLDRNSSFPQREEIERLGGRYYLVPPYYLGFSYFFTLKRLFRENGYHIVHGQLNTVNALPLLAAKCAGVPVRICHNHSTGNWAEGPKTLVKHLLRPFARLWATDDFACGIATGRWMFGKKKMDEGRVRIVPNAVETSGLLFQESERQARRAELGIGPDAFLVGHVGRFTFAKNHAYLIDIFEALHKKAPDSILLLVGEGNLRDAVERKVRHKHLEDCIRFLGVQKDIGSFYSAMDVFCLPSNYEGFPVVAVEAQLNGLPCVVSDSVTDEVSMSGNVERLSLKAGPEAWAKALYAMRNRRLTPEQSVIRRFDIHAQADVLMNVYLQMQGRNE